jgi:hypothetical protein
VQNRIPQQSTSPKEQQHGLYTLELPGVQQQKETTHPGQGADSKRTTYCKIPT